MLTIGVLVTWFGAAGIIWWLFDPGFSIALLCGSLVVVTGPTVVAPILRRIDVRDRISHILYWESVLVDAIGVFLAVLCFEWISPATDHDTWSPLVRFAIRVATGIGLGAAVGFAMVWVLRSHWIQDEHVNIFVLGMALFTYGACETILHESGVLAVIVAGFCLGVARPRQLKQVKRFKLELTELGVGTLFILLAGTLRLDQFQALGWGLIAGVAILAVVVRPIAILLSTMGRGYSIQEKAFLAWVAPRGIVAAFLASLFALELSADPKLQFAAELIHTFTFAVIGATVILQGLSAPAVAKLLRLQKEPRRTWLIVGDIRAVEPITAAMRACGVPCLGVGRGHSEERELSTPHVVRTDPLDRALLDDSRYADVAAVVSISPDVYFNELVCQRWAEVIGPDRCYQWSDAGLDSRGDDVFIGTPIWSHAGDPTDLVSQLESGSAAIGSMSLTEDTPDSLGSYLVPLIRVRQQDVTIAQHPGDSDPLPGDKIVLVRQRVAGLAGLVRDAVIMTESQPDFDAVVQALLERAQAAQPGLPVDDLHKLIVERELAMPTAMGAGVAIPHAYHDAVDAPQCYLASVCAGMTGDSPDGQPIRLVFLVLSPKGQAQAHLTSLAAIAALCSDIDYVELLESQNDAGRLLLRIRERE